MGEADAADFSTLFSAFRRRPRHRGKLLLALLILAGASAWMAAASRRGTTQVLTPTGIRMVQQGMTQQEVLRVLGKPVTAERQGDAQCMQYGRPTLHSPTFILYTVCYEDGELRDVTMRRYNAWKVTPDGAIVPAPGEEE